MAHSHLTVTKAAEALEEQAALWPALSSKTDSTGKGRGEKDSDNQSSK